MIQECRPRCEYKLCADAVKGWKMMCKAVPKHIVGPCVGVPMVFDT